MNFVFISPQFPHTYWNFCDRLRRNGVNVLGIGDASYDSLEPQLQNALTEYYRVDNMEDYSQMFRAVAFFSFKYGKIDWIESNNEYWLEQDARLRTDFHVTSGVMEDEIAFLKEKHLMKQIYINAGIPTAKQHMVSTLEAARKFIAEVGYPVIVKPDIGVGANDTYKLKTDAELENFYANLPSVPYVMEEFIEGNIRSYDAIIDASGNPLFENMTVWPPSIMDIVIEQKDLSYYTAGYMPENFRELGRKTVKAFGVKSRFVHLEYFQLTKAKKGVGEIGDYAALEVNMRPAGGYTPDMMDFAHDLDVYQIWADMCTFNEVKHEFTDSHGFCAYAGRRDIYQYVHTHEEIMEKYAGRIVMQEEMPPLNWPQMGRWMYTGKLRTEEETLEFIRFVQERVK